MNELHDYPPQWDEQDITEHPEFEGLLSKNVEALFASKGVNDDFLVKLSEAQPSELGCDLVTALVLFLKETNTDRIQRDRDYALLVSEQLQSLRETLQEIAQIHVTEETKQELVEVVRERISTQISIGVLVMKLVPIGNVLEVYINGKFLTYAPKEKPFSFILHILKYKGVAV